MNHINKPITYLYVLESSQNNRQADVRYTVYKQDGTIHIASTNTGVVEYGVASYGVELVFPTADSYVIHWEMSDGGYPANEEINIFDFKGVEIIWSGFPS